MCRPKRGTFIGQVCSFLSATLQNLSSVSAMRRLLSRVLNRVLLSRGLTTPAMGFEARGHRKMVVGLGNPGMEATRHSVGMAVLGALATRLGVADAWRGDKHVSAEVIVSEVDHMHVVLLRPRLLMNINGVSVAKAANKYDIKPEHILLVHDELDKPLGKVAVKHGGSARGHNGVRSCVDCLQTDVMKRLRVGIGRPTGKTPVDSYVLGRFSSEEKKLLDSVLVQSVDLLLSLLSEQQSQPSPAGGRHAAQETRARTRAASPAEDSGAAQSPKLSVKHEL